MNIEVCHLQCDCGWMFFGFQYETKCPQCKDVYIPEGASCVCCGASLSNTERLYCPECRVIVKKTYNRVYMQNKRTLKDEILEGTICDYDCYNCKYADCIVPADDNITGSLF